MINLPTSPAPNGASPALIDMGFFQRSALGGETLRIDRAGSRYRVTVSLPPMQPATARSFIAALLAGKSEGLRLPYPLLEAQGTPGSPVVNGAGQSGTMLALRGLAPGYVCQAGYWLSIVNQNGRHYLHNVRTGGTANGAGQLSITITPALRWPFADGATVHLAQPMIEGFVDGQEWQWAIPVNRLIALEFALEEAA